MLNEITMAQAEFLICNNKFNILKETEGYTVQVPNVIGRLVMALRAALTKATPKLQQPHATATIRSGAVAR